MAVVDRRPPGLRLGRAVEDFLADLTHANWSLATIRAYRADLTAFARQFPGPAQAITAEVLRSYFATPSAPAPATRARREASLASFLRWAYRHELIAANPMDRLDRATSTHPNHAG